VQVPSLLGMLPVPSLALLVNRKCSFYPPKGPTTMRNHQGKFMMRSVAEAFRSSSVGIIMTGMGSDDLDGIRVLARRGRYDGWPG
jgi:chemotaxis response regulator CheB